jgi:retron-type reverse transcriptase
MKRLGRIWPQLVSFENLLIAYKKARLGKAGSPAVSLFALNLESNLLVLQSQLKRGVYRPGQYRLFTLYERKPRRIAAAPFCDRVVHHALMNVIEPPLDRRFIFDSYACRKGKSVHAAVNRYQGWSRKYPYVLKMDVRQYFASIDHELLKQKIRHVIKDKSVLSLMDLIIDTSPPAVRGEMPVYFPGDDLLTPITRRTGLPIGNLTSQFFANLYLNDLDHHIKQTLGVRAYLRYVDDLAALGRGKNRLHEVKSSVKEYLEKERLRLHPSKAHISHCSHGIDLFGYHVFPYRRRLRSDNGHRFTRRLRGWAKSYRRGRLDWADINPRVQSWIGHARHADSMGLRESIFSGTVFRRE